MRTLLVAFIGGITGTIFASFVAVAWTGPTSAPPNGNVSVPINVGTTDQIKNAGLGVNSLAVFGNTILSGSATTYLNFGSTAGTNGYGIRDNSGTLEFKNTGGSWSALASTGSTFSQIKFSDDTTQTAAATSGGISATTYPSCNSVPGINYSSCSVSCPSGYRLTGCTAWMNGNSFPMAIAPSGNGCGCYNSPGGTFTCYAYCAK